MNQPNLSKGVENQLLSKLGGKFILRLQVIAQLLSSLVGTILGLYFIYVTADLTRIQFFQLLVCLVCLTVIVNLLLLTYTNLITKQARAHLDNLLLKRSLPAWSDEKAAWKEIITFPGRSAFTQFIATYIVVLLPAVLYMYMIVGVDWGKVVYIIVGGFIAEALVIIQTLLFLDHQLSPVRRVLVPSDPTQQDVQTNFGQMGRLQLVFNVLIITAILMIGLLGYQKLRSTLLPGANPVVLLQQFQSQLIIIGICILAVTVFTATLSAQAIISPIQEMLRVTNHVQAGIYSERAAVVTSDETAQLTIRLNQMLDQLQTAKSNVDHQIQERTSVLQQRNEQLQATAAIATEAAAQRDLNTLLSVTVKMITGMLGYYHAGIFFIDEEGEYAILQTASSEGGQRMLARGHRLEVGQQGIVGAAAYLNRPHVAMDVGKDALYFNNPDLPLTRSEAAIPLSVYGNVFGVLDIQSTEPDAFSREVINMLQALANQLALAIQNARLNAETQNTVRQLEIATIENVQHSWSERIRRYKHAYRYTGAGLVPYHESDGKQPLADSSEPSEDGTNRLNIPIVLRGQRIGVITLRRKGESPWSEVDRSLATEVANQVGLALENARLLEETQHRAAQEQSLNEFTSRLSRSLDPDAILQTTVRELHQLPNVTEVSVYITPQNTSPGEAPQKE